MSILHILITFSGKQYLTFLALLHLDKIQGLKNGKIKTKQNLRNMPSKSVLNSRSKIISRQNCPTYFFIDLYPCLILIESNRVLSRCAE